MDNTCLFLRTFCITWVPNKFLLLSFHLDVNPIKKQFLKVEMSFSLSFSSDYFLSLLICREIMIAYNNLMWKTGDTLFELLSEALGLDPNYLKDIGCVEEMTIGNGYYPECPQP